MNRRQLETLLLTLESTPALLARAVTQVSPSDARRRPAAGGFSLLEHLWHLADLEREGYGVRIRRILTEEEPSLSDFDGERIARERCYQEKDIEEGLATFAVARTKNLEKLRTIHASDWRRNGQQDGVGRLALSDIPRMMADHDRSHSEEIAQLMAQLQAAVRLEPDGADSAVA